jgi:hypothetical protein
MMPASARSRSDLELAEWVRQETGIEVSPWQIERWRAAGLLQGADHAYPGSGSVATYSEDARHQAAELTQLSKRYRKTDELVRVLFYRDLYVGEDAVRQSFGRFLARMEAWIGPANSEVDLNRIDGLAQRLAALAERTKQGRGLKRRLRGREETPEAIAAGVYYTLLYAIKEGSMTTQEGLSELLDASGLSGLFDDQVASIGPIAPNSREDIEHFFGQAKLTTVRGLLESSTMEDLAESRDLIRLCFPFFKSVGVLVSRWFDLPNAFGFAYIIDAELDDLDMATWIPFGLALLPAARSEMARNLLANMRQHAPYFEELAAWAMTWPQELIVSLRTGDKSGLDRLPQEERDRIRQTALALQVGGHGFSWTEEAETYD